VYNIEHLDKEVLNCTYESLKNTNGKEFKVIPTKQFIFSPFINLLNGYINVPSKFVDKNLTDFDVLKPLLNFPCNTPVNYTAGFMQTIVELNNRLVESESLVAELIEKIK
jgi:hypothetical protein